MIEGDQHQISTQVRIMAVRAIKELGRPITAHEVEKWIMKKYPDIWKAVSQKCYDYVRVILSLTKNNVIIKFKCKKIRPGIDKRACFYGLSTVNYDTTTWESVGTGSKASNTHNTKKKKFVYSETSSSSDSDNEIIPYDTPCDQISQCWISLKAKMQSESPFWMDIFLAISDVKDLCRCQIPPNEAIRQIFSKYPLLSNTTVVSEVTFVLQTEAGQAMQENFIH